MSDYQVVDEAVKSFENYLLKYKTTYLDVVPYIGHKYVIKELLKGLQEDFAIVYFANNICGDSQLKELKKYFEELKSQEYGYKYATTLKTIKEMSITFIEATEQDIDQKIKTVDSTASIILINDCTLTSKAISIEHLKKTLNPCRIINLVYNTRLSEKEHILINTNRVGYIYVDGKTEPNNTFIDGFIVNPSEDLAPFKKESDLNIALIQAGLKRYKELAQIHSSKGNIIEGQFVDVKYLILANTYNEAKGYFNLFEYNTDLKIALVNILPNLDDDVYDNNQVIFACGWISEIPEKYKNKFVVITFLKNACGEGDLFNIVKNEYNKSLICSEEQYDYKYLYIFDNPEQVKKSLQPVYKTKTPELVKNSLRNDIEPFWVDCVGLQSVDYELINEDNEDFYKCLIKSCKAVLGQPKSLQSFINKGLNYNKKPQTILIDSIIYSYLNYDFKTTYYTHDIQDENFSQAVGEIGTFLSKCMLAENRKIDIGSKTNILKMLEKAVITPTITKDYTRLYGRSVDIKNNPNILYQPTTENNLLYNMIVNDLQNLNSSLFAKILGYTLELYTKIKKTPVQKRQMVNKKVLFPIVNKFEKDKSDNVDLDKSYSPMVKFSESEQIKNNAYKYAKKLKPETEKMFKDYLKNAKWVDWWCKNGDIGEPNFSVATYDKKDMPICFYPDWIIKIKGKKDGRDIILIVDTKAGMTLDDSGSTGAKIKALETWCDIQNKKPNSKQYYICGILTFEGGFWKISKNNIDYIIDMNYSNFVIFEEWLKGKLS